MNLADYYSIIRTLHIICALGLIIFSIFNLKFISNKVLSVFFSSAFYGWVLLFTGCLLLYLVKGIYLSQFWLIISICLFIGIQIFDSVWADKLEALIDKGHTENKRKLIIWNLVKVTLYLSIAILMIKKPTI